MIRELVLTGLKKQHLLLRGLKEQLEQKESLSDEDCRFYTSRTQLVEENLKELRRIHRDRMLSRLLEICDL